VDLNRKSKDRSGTERSQGEADRTLRRRVPIFSRRLAKAGMASREGVGIVKEDYF
jgi:hypothetical protein